jgi:hypothetical protein
MKTLKMNSAIVRVKEKDVDRYLDMGYSFTNKKEWKVIRDAGKKVSEKTEKPEKTEKAD